MEYREFKAKTVNDAITEASIEFGITSDMLDYQVIEEGSTGLLGLFSKNAVIKARPKEEPEKEYSIKDEFQTSPAISLKNVSGLKKDPNREKKKPVHREPEAAKTSKAEVLKKQIQNFEIKPEAAPEPDEKAQMTIMSAKAAVKNEKANTQAPAAEHRIISGAEAENKEVNDILNLLFEKMEINAKVETSIDMDDKIMNVNIIGDNTNDLIGKKGQTLDAIQYLISIVINKKKGDYYRVKVDTNNYRERRQKTLENQAKNVASKVKKTRRKVVMEPMNPYERRVIHAYLQSDKSVTTKSEGEEPNRKVVVYYKKQ